LADKLQERIMKKKNLGILVSSLLIMTLVSGCMTPSELGKQLRRSHEEAREKYGEYVEEEAVEEEAIEAPAKEEVNDAPSEGVKAPENIYVSSAEDLVASIQSDGIIHLAPGYYNITECLKEPTLDYNGIRNTMDAYVGSNEEFDGLELMIAHVDNLTIVCDDDTRPATIVCEPRYADVMDFYSCRNITISNIVAGHTPDKGSCSGNVLNFENCEDIYLSYLDLYGCGTYGIGTYECKNLRARFLKIRECSYGLLDILNSSSVSFDDCTFTFEEGYTQIECVTSQLSFYNCVFLDLHSDTEFVYVSDDSILSFVGCDFDVTSEMFLKEFKGKNLIVLD